MIHRKIPKLLIVLAIINYNLIFAQNIESDTLYTNALKTFEDSNELIFSDSEINLAQTSPNLQIALFEKANNSFINNYFKSLKKEEIEINQEELFSQDNFEEDKIFEPKSKKKSILTSPFILKNGDTITIDYGYSNDKISAKQSVSSLFNDELNEILTNTNNSLKKSALPLIRKIYISTTTNGKHSTKSNHYSGYALDISRINGVKIINTNYSFKLNRTLEDHFGDDFMDLIDLEANNIVVDSKSYDLDLIFLSKLVFMLQSEITKSKKTRENFGPFLRTKFHTENLSFLSNYKVKGHQDHIHYSVR